MSCAFRSRWDIVCYRPALYWWLAHRLVTAPGYCDSVLRSLVEDLGGLGGVW